MSQNLKNSEDGFSSLSLKALQKTLHNFYYLCDADSTVPSAFHVQGKRGRKHLHTQGTAIKLNGSMEKTIL